MGSLIMTCRVGSTVLESRRGIAILGTRPLAAAILLMTVCAMAARRRRRDRWDFCQLKINVKLEVIRTILARSPARQLLRISRRKQKREPIRRVTISRRNTTLYFMTRTEAATGKEAQKAQNQHDRLGN